MAAAKRKRAPARKRVTIKEVDALNKRIKELELKLKKYEQLALGIHSDGRLETMKNYTIFILEEGSKNCLGMAEELKKALVIPPNFGQMQEKQVEKVGEVKEEESTDDSS